MSNELQPCPFCEAELEPFGPAQHNHPVNNCWLRSVRIMDADRASWNNRPLAEPVASAAPSGELPPLPKEFGQIDIYGNDGIVKCVDGYTADQMRGYAIDYGMKIGRAAIAHQPPKEALTDVRIKELSLNVFMRYSSDNEDYTFDVLRKFARAIESSSEPNKQLVAALRELIDCMEHEVTSKHPALEVARNAMAAAGVAPLPQDKEGA